MSGSILILTAGRSNVGRNCGIAKESSGSELQFPDAKKGGRGPLCRNVSKRCPRRCSFEFFRPARGGVLWEGDKMSITGVLSNSVRMKAIRSEIVYPPLWFWIVFLVHFGVDFDSYGREEQCLPKIWKWQRGPGSQSGVGGSIGIIFKFARQPEF